MNWVLKQTKQCAKCPWKVSTDPRTIPNGYTVEKHKALKTTIAAPNSAIEQLNKTAIQMMACHEGNSDPCIGWLHNQLGTGNNIALRIRMMSCLNAKDIEILGEQHPTFEDTIPSEEDV